MEPIRPIIVGVAGGSASGKTSVCEKVFQKIKDELSGCSMIPLDSFYKDLTYKYH